MSIIDQVFPDRRHWINSKLIVLPKMRTSVCSAQQTWFPYKSSLSASLTFLSYCKNKLPYEA